jgi:hypothetical protein
MTSPSGGLKAPTDTMGSVANQWQGMATDLTPGEIDQLIAAIQGGQFPDQQEMTALLAALQKYKSDYLANAGANGVKLAGSAKTLAGQDHDAGVDLAKTVGPFLALAGPGAQLVGQSLQALANFSGNAAQAGLYFTSGLAGQALTANSHHDPTEHTPAPGNVGGPVLNHDDDPTAAPPPVQPTPHIGHQTGEQHGAR